MSDLKNDSVLSLEDDTACGMKVHGSVVVWSKGQIVIPSDVRKMLEIEPGDSLFCITKDGKAIWLIPTQNLNNFMEYMKSEMEMLRAVAQNESKSPEISI